MNKQRLIVALTCALALSAAGTAAIARTNSDPSQTNAETTRLATQYSAFAGSDANADALVNGLRTGASITLETNVVTKNANGTTTTSTVPTTFTPATHRMGYGSVNIALGLAEQQLGNLGITAPTGAEIQAALNGGAVTLATGKVQTLPGILALHATGHKWGQVANTIGVKLGSVVSASHTAHSHAGATNGPHGNSVATVDRPEHPVHPVHPDHPQQPMMPQRPDIPDRGGRPGGH